MKTTVNLNETELNILIACAKEVKDNTNGQFGFISNIKEINNLSRNQIAGYVSQLVQKDLIWIDKQFNSIILTKEGIDLLINTKEGKLLEVNKFQVEA